MNPAISPLLTDLYQLTMAAAAWQAGVAEQESVFHLFFRRLPFGGGYAIAAGLEPALEWLENFRFSPEDIAYLAALKAGNGGPLFKREFLDYLAAMKLALKVEAVAEGSVVFAHEPLLRVTGPLVQAQLVETALLNVINFQTLIATKAARVCEAAAGGTVVEFGLRRAQGPDGGVAASRAAYLGGCAATSNVVAGQIHGIPVKGTHAHSWVMAFDDEQEAFDRYVEAMPDNSILLVDTYDTLDGVAKAIEAGKKLVARGHRLDGIRLDSGDLAWLSIEARKRLDAAGFTDAKIVASNDLDEHLIESLRHQGARIDVWGVGTQMVTGGGQPALGGVYKLGAIRGADGEWKPRFKRSEQSAKASVPGILQVRRYEVDGRFVADAIYDETRSLPDEVVVIDPADPLRRKQVPEDAFYTDLLRPVMRGGRRMLPAEALEKIRERVKKQLTAVDPAVKRLANPHAYPAGLEGTLAARRDELNRREA
ncbi:nicotinate phosphoribosyltransferase [Luteolibacter sp. LG18]|uniref:nicotinate phosphoribosyltransferase n=1 Tax=Luteolibacter sp. LG18 TaxID=2819286 RepID=UPI002B2D015F|nr:nicotinate phosphoribosyltransferase [Luteolibacter sp. LG18]